MSEKKLSAAVTISRRSDGVITIEFVDQTSRIRFAEVEMSPEEFANAVTGFGYRPAKLTVTGLEFVGKVPLTESRTIEYPNKCYSRAEMSEWLKDNAREDGWFIDTYLGSQSSVIYRDGKTILNYTVTKYVDPNGEPNE